MSAAGRVPPAAPAARPAARRAEQVPPATLVARARAGDPRAVGRLLSLVEAGGSALADLLGALGPAALDGVPPWVVGVTGPPGVGKSTFLAGLIGSYRARDLRVAALAVDPSSPFTGGALLGDRIRMQEHFLDPGVYIRSMAGRGHLGGLAHATPTAVRVLQAVGFDVVLVETVGAGQAEVDVAAVADTTVVLLAPGLGDDVQAEKAGLMEIGDVLVVNKADHVGADQAVHDLRRMVALGSRAAGDWRPIVVTAVSVRAGGVAEAVAALDRHRGWLGSSGRLAQRRVARAAAELEAAVFATVRARLGAGATAPVADLVTALAAGDLDPAAAATAALAAICAGGGPGEVAGPAGPKL